MTAAETLALASACRSSDNQDTTIPALVSVGLYMSPFFRVKTIVGTNT